MIRMTKGGAFMDAYTVQQCERLESKGWSVVPDEPKKAPAKKAPVKKARRVKK